MHNQRVYNFGSFTDEKVAAMVAAASTVDHRMFDMDYRSDWLANMQNNDNARAWVNQHMPG